MDTKVRIAKADKYGLVDHSKVVVYRTRSTDIVGTFAMQLIERWGLVAALPDGEDSAGRAKLRLPTPDELVTRAFDIAEKTLEVAEARGHVVQIPDLNEINSKNDEKLRRKEADEERKEAARQAASAD